MGADPEVSYTHGLVVQGCDSIKLLPVVRSNRKTQNTGLISLRIQFPVFGEFCSFFYLSGGEYQDFSPASASSPFLDECTFASQFEQFSLLFKLICHVLSPLYIQ